MDQAILRVNLGIARLQSAILPLIPSGAHMPIMSALHDIAVGLNEIANTAASSVISGGRTASAAEGSNVSATCFTGACTTGISGAPAKLVQAVSETIQEESGGESSSGENEVEEEDAKFFQQPSMVAAVPSAADDRRKKWREAQKAKYGGEQINPFGP